MRAILCWVGIFCAAQLVAAQSACDGGSCYPDIGDLLVGREDNLTATSTCGMNRPEKYCIVSHLKDQEKCFICDSNRPERSHKVENVITTFNNRLETWWQSENGLNEVSLRLNLETSFHFTHLIMTFKTFRPAAMLIERSNDYGQTWQIYRYFAADCEESWPGVAQWPPREIDEIICDNRYSLIEPSTEGEVVYKVLEPSLIPNEDAYSDKIQNLLTITNLRINFTAMHTLGDDLLDHRSSIKEKYYYALYELIVRGNCFCYGHADECRPIDPSLERPDLIRRRIYQLKNSGIPFQPKKRQGYNQVNGKCQCEHNTIGLNCEKCLPFYQDVPWKPASRGEPNECKLCNCNEHATSCHFDEAVYEASGRVSGGVCENCQHNTAGQHCELCLPGFYPHPDRAITDPRRCEPCNCEVAGSLNNGLCLQESDKSAGVIAGDCVCKDFVEGRRCDRCKAGFFNLDESNPYGCTVCDCDDLGTLPGQNTCDSQTGQCICKRYTTGRRCDQCLAQTWGMSADGDGCRECFCDVGGAYDNDCDEFTGQCNCRPHINQRRCNDSVSGFFLPDLDFYVFEAEDATGERTFLYKQKFDPNAMWTGPGFRRVGADGTLVFIVKGLPASMEYDFILRYSPYTEETTEGISVRIERPAEIAIGSVCDNTTPQDDNWIAHLRGYPSSSENLGTHCMEMELTYKVIFTFPGKMDAVSVDSLVLVPKYSGISMFHGSVEGDQRSHEFEELDCQDEAMILPPIEQNEICAGLVFSMSAIIHDGSIPCDCDPQGSLSSICDKMGGQCVCKPNVMGRRCDQCVPGTYGLGPDGCRPCECDSQGALQPEFQYCDPTGGQCRCRDSGITGRKCDRCKAGFYQFPDCFACQCNGHSDYCDQDTGMCINCREHTTGEHCELCEDGYYGNPILGSGDQCKPCMCPGGPGSGRQFATTCSETINRITFQRQVQCNCLSGYTGETCSQCAAGYYGNPYEIGGYCTACECSRNIDLNDPNACDAATGVCTGCLYDTAGPHCERCRDFYYGNAQTRDCRACACDVRGTIETRCVGGQCHCDVANGQCPCLPNMTGRQCESCLPNHYRGEQGEGCKACNCHPENSFSDTCNEFTGQCQCKDGFGGLTCSDCASGYWGDPPRACKDDTTQFVETTTTVSTTKTLPVNTVATTQITELTSNIYQTSITPKTPMTSPIKRTTTTVKTSKPCRGDQDCEIFDTEPFSTTKIATTAEAYPTTEILSTTPLPTEASTTLTLTTAEEIVISTQMPIITTAMTTLETMTAEKDATTTKNIVTMTTVYSGSTVGECNCDPLGSKSAQCNPRTGECECHDGVGGRLCDRCHRGFTGQVPYCEPCGDCFDNWDAIISDLEARANAAIAKAQAIQETGISGAYEDEFDIIEKMLDDLRKKHPGLNDPENDPAEFNDLIDKIKEGIAAEEQKLKDMEEEMNRIQADNSQVSDGLVLADEAIADIQREFDNLNEQKKSITKASPAAAYKQVEDAAERSENAEKAAKAATTEPGSLVEQSQAAREEVEEVFAEKLLEFEDKHKQAELDLEDVKQEVDNLSVADLNADVCGKATEDCDETCGGAGCAQGCGGLGCNGAVTNANVAQDRAQKTKDILDQLNEDALDFQNRMQGAKDSAQDAKVAAEQAKKQADEVEGRVRERNEKIRDLIGRIRKFLDEDRATPEQIEELALSVLGLSLKAGRQEIDQLSESIRDLVDRLPDVDRILDETQADLDRANELKDAAVKAKADAAAVAGDANAVVEALDAAEEASNLAEQAKSDALVNIEQAQQKINDISSSAIEVLKQVGTIQKNLMELDNQLLSVESKLTNNRLEARNAFEEATIARSMANMAKLALDNEADLINQANSTINAKKAQVDRLQKLRESAADLSTFVQDNLQKLQELNDSFDKNEISLTKKNAELIGLLNRVQELYNDIEKKESKLRECQ